MIMIGCNNLASDYYKNLLMENTTFLWMSDIVGRKRGICLFHRCRSFVPFFPFDMVNGVRE